MAQTISSAGGRDEKRTDGNQEKRTTKRDETHAHKVAMKRTKRRGGGAERGVAKEGEEERPPYMHTAPPGPEPLEPERRATAEATMKPGRRCPCWRARRHT